MKSKRKINRPLGPHRLPSPGWPGGSGWICPGARPDVSSARNHGAGRCGGPAMPALPTVGQRGGGTASRRAEWWLRFAKKGWAAALTTRQQRGEAPAAGTVSSCAEWQRGELALVETRLKGRMEQRGDDIASNTWAESKRGGKLCVTGKNGGEGAGAVPIGAGGRRGLEAGNRCWR
jgi:hypothetical protein